MAKATKELSELTKIREALPAEQVRAGSLVQEAPPEGVTRHQIAKYFIIGYFILFGIVLLGYPIYNLTAYSIVHSDAINVKITDIIQIFSTATGPLVGFVLGYYFKSKHE